MTRIVTEFFFIIFIFRFGILISFTEGYEPLCQYCDVPKNINLQSNLKNLLSTLQSIASHSDTGFANTSIDAGTSNQLNGLIMCYIDSNQDSCSDCLNDSITKATTICPNSITESFTYDWCFLHYSNENFLASLPSDNDPTTTYVNQHNVSNSSTFNKTVSDLLNLLRPEAMKEPLLYASGNKTDPGINQTVYGLVQCTRDLDKRPDLCGLCLRSIISSLISDLTEDRPYKGARYSSTSCYLRYELYPLPLLTFKPLNPLTCMSKTFKKKTGSRNKHVAVMVISTFGAFLFIFVAGVWFWRTQRRKQISISSEENEDMECGACGECRMFQLSELTSATINFSEENRLGQGGFGSVYKGTLLDGTIIAVKRLEGWSKQGFFEFKNEVELLAKLKHNNLVKLVGHCLEKNEKLLCYEYLPSGSLDRILETDKMKRDKLGWQTRYKIIKGISSGLQYLHVESGLKIVHRDLKPSNILLDEHMNPKISDFGLARFYNDDKSHMETSKCRGTYGYMAPELAMHGMYSNKFDVYSFGVMLLEIVTGRKISSFVNNQLASNLISYARQHWEKGKVEVVKDPTLDLEDVCLKQLSRCIHLGLLCVEQDPNNRPDMDAINLMLRNDSITIPPLPRFPSRMDFSPILDSMNKRSNDDMLNYEGISAVSLPLEPTRHDVSPSVSSVSA